MKVDRGHDAVVAGGAIAAYLGVLQNGRAVDDVVIAANPLFARWSTLPSALVAPWWYPEPHLYRPLTSGLIGTELLLGAGGTVLPHVVSIALHAATSVLVMRLARRWVAPPAALAAGLFFALLPAHAEAVATLVGQAELLAGLWLVTLMLVVTDGRDPSRRRDIAVLLLSAAALASKEGGVAAPVLALAAAWRTAGSRPHAWQTLRAATVGTALLLLARYAVLGTLGGDLSHPVFRTVSAGRRLLTALALLPRSVAMLLLPVRPDINYAPSWDMVLHPSDVALAGGVAIVLVALVAITLHARRPTTATLAVVIGAATLAPTANLLFASGVARSGRGMYAPSVGAALLVGAGVAAAVRRWPAARVGLAVGALLCWCAVVAVSEVPAWRSSESATAAAASRSPESYWSPRARAYAARDAGRATEALGYFRTAAALMPVDWEMLTDGATVALAQHDTADAERWLTAAVAARPGATRARVRLDALNRARRR